MRLKKEVKVLDQIGSIQGHITNESPHKKPVIVLMYQLLPEGKKLVAYSIYHQSDEFHFRSAPGHYMLAAFEDANEDMMYQASEYAGYFGPPSTIIIEPGTTINHVNVTLQAPRTVSLRESPNLSSPATKANQGRLNTRVGIGEVVNLDDARFSHENGRLGLWQPIRFWEEVGGGLFFLEPFSQDKIPVLFVHGAGGHPQQWSTIIHRLDRTRFQPWVVFYPSGFRLNWIAEGIGKSLSEVFVTQKFEKLIVVAHSMGGMIARSLLNVIAQRQTDYQGEILFITLSTPWSGHQAAQIGVDYAPAVIPSWVDMVPGSPFQQSLFRTVWPNTMKYYLLFSFNGGRNPFTNGNDDGTVSLVSQLNPKAQEAAIKTFGFNEDHVSILKSSEVSEKINGLLRSPEGGKLDLQESP